VNNFRKTESQKLNFRDLRCKHWELGLRNRGNSPSEVQKAVLGISVTSVREDFSPGKGLMTVGSESMEQLAERGRGGWAGGELRCRQLCTQLLHPL